MDYVYYAIDPTDSLSHYGTKNMHWHERRYQNYDGTWTEEGKARRRKNGVPRGFGITRFMDSNGKITQEGIDHYAKKPGKLLSDNTKDRIKQGAKIGAVIGASVGGIGGLAVTALYASAGASTAALGAAFCGSVVNAGIGGLSGSLTGLRYGTIVGTIETNIGRSFIKNQIGSNQN